MIYTVMNEMIDYFGDDVKRVNHALKVYGFAVAIAKKEGVCEREFAIVSLAAILHDIGIKEAERKYCSSAGKYQEMEGPPIAREILLSCAVEPDMNDRICFLVGNHHSYQKIDGLDFRILVEADFLVNIFEEGMKKEEIEKIRGKIFQTKSGLCFLQSMYLS